MTTARWLDKVRQRVAVREGVAFPPPAPATPSMPSTPAPYREQILAGLERARAAGKKLGRPYSSPELEARIRALREQRMGKLAIARHLGCGVSTVMRVLAFENPIR